MNKFKHAVEVFLNHKLFLIAIVLSCLYTLGTQSDRQFGWTNPKNTIPENLKTIHSDGSGYYAYLPQWFIYKSNPPYTFNNTINDRYKTARLTESVIYDNESKKYRNKCYTGSAICIAPFFLTNHLINHFIYGNGDGYSKSYQFIVALSALFYWLLGVIAIIKISKLLEISNFSIALVITLISIGTNLNFYTSFYSSYSHVHSFFAINWFMYFALNWAKTKKNKYLFLLSITLSLIFIIRPINIIIILILPFLFQNWSQFSLEIIERIKFKKKTLIISFLLFLILILFHYSVKYQEAGELLINSYKNEGFDFLFSPKFLDVLFSYRKGLFTYSPVLLLLIPGIYYLYKFNKFLFIGWVIVFAVYMYIISSWWCWWYGGGHGMRPFVDFMGFLSLPILILIDRISLVKKTLVLIFSISMIYYYQILQYQYNNDIIKYDNMSQADYWTIFLKTDDRFSWMLAFEEYSITKEKIINQKRYNFNPSKQNWTNKNPSKDSFSLIQDDPNLSFVFHIDSNWSDFKIGIRFSSEIKITNQASNPSIIYNFYKNGSIVKKQEQYIGNKIEEVNHFQFVSIDYLNSQPCSNYDSIDVILTKGIPTTDVRKLNVTFYSIKTD